MRARSKFDHFAEAVGEYLPEFADQLAVPQMNMWLRMPGSGHADPDARDAAAWAQRARSRGVLVTPGSLYYAPGTVARTDELRVGLASIPEARIVAEFRHLSLGKLTYLAELRTDAGAHCLEDARTDRLSDLRVLDFVPWMEEPARRR